MSLLRTSSRVNIDGRNAGGDRLPEKVSDIVKLEPKLPLEQIVRTVAHTNLRFLITQEVLRCVVHEPNEEPLLKRRIGKILDEMGYGRGDEEIF